MFLRSVLIVLLAIFTSKGLTSPFDVFETNGYRLPNNTLPVSYDIHITTDLNKDDNRIFFGTTIITLRAQVDTDKIILHAADLDNIKISLIEKESGLEFEDIRYTLNINNNFFTISSKSGSLKLKAGKEYLLTVSYSGIHTRRAKGFFTSSYKNGENNRVWLATTHFEPTYARYAFPCYDEPALKAKFRISLTHPSNYSALSNMPAEGEPVTDDGMSTTNFQETPLMSTYTVAFLITNYEHISVDTKNTTHRVFSPSIAKKKGKFSLDVSTKTLQHLEDYFGIDYPLPKMDHISVPALPFSAMENWGLIIYQYGYLLPSSETSALYNLATANVVVHELTHQWFGNLVSPKWWKWTWLNEGLTTFYSDKVLNTIFPEWDSVEYSLFKEGSWVVWGTTEKRPLTHDVETTTEILNTFSQFSYYKASYVLRMFEYALTEKTFKKGIVQYLNKFQYSTADENDLFQCLQNAALEDGIPFYDKEEQVQKMMSSWTNQNGYPLLTVTRDYQSGKFTIKQNDSLEEKSSWFSKLITFLRTSSGQRWWIPITFATMSKPNFDNTAIDVIFPDINEIDVDPSELDKPLLKNDWLILNKQQIGVYRVNYDEKNWELISKALKDNPKSIHAYNKAQLIRDLEYFAGRDEVSEDTLISYLSYLTDEDEIFPWIEATGALSRIYERQQERSDESAAVFKIFIKTVIGPMYKKIGYESKAWESPMTEYLRPKLFNLACEVELEDCAALVKDKYDKVLKENEPISPYMTTAVLCQFVKKASEREMDDLYEYLNRNKPYPFDKREVYLIEVLVCKPNAKLAHFLLNYLDIDIMDLFLRAMSEL